METRCHFCRTELVSLHGVAVGERKPAAAHSIWADTSRGRIGICSACYELEQFEGLSTKDIGAIHYMFGTAYLSSEDSDFRRSIDILTRAVELLPVPEVQSALGCAHWRAGNRPIALTLCREALERQPTHFGHEKARAVLDGAA